MPKTFEVYGEVVTIVELKYSGNQRLAIALEDSIGGPFATLTVNIPELDALLKPGEVFVKIHDENAEIAVAAVKSGYFSDTGKRVPTGFVEAAIFTYNPDEAHAEYTRKHGTLVKGKWELPYMQEGSGE